MPLQPQRRLQRMAMSAVGAALVGAGLLVAPGTGGAEVPGVPSLPVNLPTTTTTSLPLPSQVDETLKKIEELTGATVTTTTTTAPTTTTTSTTTTTTAPTTTTTTAPKPTEEPKDAEVKGITVEATLDDLLARIEVPVIDVAAIVADYQRVDFPAYTPRFGKRSTLEVVELLNERAMPFEQQAQVLAPFPIAGAASYTDDWGAPRYNPYFHLHEGTDIFAAGGTPVIATMAGTVTRAQMGTAVGGNVVYLELADGTYFYYAHLDDIAPGISPGMAVQPGQVLGTVGSTGNAEGGMPHLHFEIHPGGGDPVPPAPYLDAWLAAALAEARQAGSAIDGNFPLPAVGGPTPQAGVLSAQPASFGRESGGTLLFVLPGAGVLWWRRRRSKAAFEAALARIKAGGS